MLEERGYAEYIEAVISRKLEGVKMEGFYKEVYEYLKEHYDTLSHLIKNIYQEEAILESFVDFRDKNCPELYAMAIVVYAMSQGDFRRSYILK